MSQYGAIPSSLPNSQESDGKGFSESSSFEVPPMQKTDSHDKILYEALPDPIKSAEQFRDSKEIKTSKEYEEKHLSDSGNTELHYGALPDVQFSGSGNIIPISHVEGEYHEQEQREKAQRTYSGLPATSPRSSKEKLEQTLFKNQLARQNSGSNGSITQITINSAELDPKQLNYGVPLTSNNNTNSEVVDLNTVNQVQLSPRSQFKKSINSIKGQTSTWWELDYNELELGEIMSDTPLTTIYKALWREQDVAFKHWKSITNNLLEDFKKEAILMMNLRPHVNIVKIYGVCCQISKPVGLVLEYPDAGTLKQVLEKQKPSVLQCLVCAKDIARAVKHLHADKIVHRDIQCSNVWVSEDKHGFRCQLSGFSLSRVLEDTTQKGKTLTTMGLGAVRWMAPESILNRTYSIHSDSYMFGSALIEIFTGGQPPFANIQSDSTVSNGVVFNTIKHTFPDDIPSSIVKLIESCLVYEPEKRPDFSQILKSLEELEQEIRENPFYS